MSNLVTLATYEQSKTAYFLKDKLENEFIDCFFASAGEAGSEWEKIRVQVKEEDVESAIRVMLRIQNEYGMAIEKIDPGHFLRRIIVPTDFTKGSEYACYYAIHLAQKINAEIKLLHVFEDPSTDLTIKESATYLEYVNSALKETEQRAKAEMVDFIHKMKAYMDARKIGVVKIHSSIVKGNIIGQIKGISKRYKPDVIVLGTLGKREDSKSVFLGLIHSIVHGLDVPVYAIPGPCTREDFEDVNILYATDLNEKEHHSLERLLKIVKPFHKQVTCIHIDTAQNPAKKERLAELNIQLKKDYSQHDIQCRIIEDADVYNGIKEFAEKNHMNLLSFTVHKRGIFEKLFRPNLFQKILQESSLPILLFPS